MDLKELSPYIALVVGFLATLIKIPKIEVNVWGLAKRSIVKTFTSEIVTKLDNLTTEITTVKNDLQEHLDETQRQRIKTARLHILNFSNDLISGKRKTAEEFHEILSYIDFYETYFKEHTNEVNNVANLSMNNIKKAYEDCCKNNSFLPQD